MLGLAATKKGPERPLCIVISGVADGARTHDNRNHNPGLYQLSYSHHSRNYTRFLIILRLIGRCRRQNSSFVTHLQILHIGPGFCCRPRLLVLLVLVCAQAFGG